MVSVVDGGPSQEDPDSMGQLFVQKKNVLFEADEKEAAARLPSPISSKFIIFCFALSLTRVLRDTLYQYLRE